MTTINEIRDNLTEAQKSIINVVWEDHLERESWHDWLSAETLYRKFAKPSESRRYGKDYVLAALSSLSGSILSEQERGYVLTFLGMLLTDQCRDGVVLLVRYLELVQSKYDSGLELKEIKFRNQELGDALDISELELKALRELIDYGRFGSVSGSKDNWEVSASIFMDEALVEDDLKAYVERQALKDYDPALPVSNRERSLYLSERRDKELPSPEPVYKISDPYRLVGTVLARRYELRAYAGGGGMGAVYRATDNTNRNTVAVKILKPDIVARNPEYIGLFDKEVKAAQQLNHPNIVRVLDSGIAETATYMVMEWLEGKSLEDVVAEEQLPISRIVRIFDQVCSGIAYAHDNNVIHLDLKPANILLVTSEQTGDQVKIIDFGLARIISKDSGTTVTRFRGTHQYCAPEQFGGKVGKRSDIYSLGATLYYLISGVIPFGASYINAKIYPNLELPPIPSVARQNGLSYEIDIVLRRALQKNPTLRQQSAKQLFEEFDKAVSGKGRVRTSRPIEEQAYATGAVTTLAKQRPRRHIPEIVDDALLMRREAERMAAVPDSAEVLWESAPVGRRIVAAGFDLLVVAFASSPFAAVIELTSGEWRDWRVAACFAGIVLTIMFIYQTVAVAFSGRTWGMRLLSLRAVDARTGLIPTAGQCARRAIFYILSLATLGVGLLLALFDREGRAAHDHLSRTVVVGE